MAEPADPDAGPQTAAELDCEVGEVARPRVGSQAMDPWLFFAALGLACVLPCSVR